MAKPTKPLRVHLEKINTPLQPAVDEGLRRHAKHSPITAAAHRKILEEPTTQCGQGKGVSPSRFLETAPEDRCQRCHGKAGCPPQKMRTAPVQGSEPIKWETARTLMRALSRSYPNAEMAPRLAVEVRPVAVNKTIDNEVDAQETIRRCVERHGALPDEPDTAAILAEAATELAKRLNKAPPCRIKLEGVSCWKNIRAAGTRFTAIKPDTMCDACAAMWHVSMAEIALRRRAHEDTEDAAEKARAALAQTRTEVEG